MRVRSVCTLQRQLSILMNILGRGSLVSNGVIEMKIKILLLVLISGFWCWNQASSQVVITSADMFNEEGLYYKAYSNGDAKVSAVNIIGSEGGPNFWDFTAGPRNEVIKFDYLEPSDSIFVDEFPEATIMERARVEETGEMLGEIFFESVEGLGRKVYGFVRDTNDPAQLVLGLDGPLKFKVPQVDFPANIKYGDEWSNVITFDTNIDIGGGLGSLGQFRIIIKDDFIVDAYGFAELENIGFVDVLRLNTVTSQDVQIQQDDGTFVSMGATSYVRIYRWLAQGKGIVAELTSDVSSDLSGNASPPSKIFETGSKYFRMFETNKENSGGCSSADPVSDLRISWDTNNNRVFLRWTKVECASKYRVLSSTDLSDKSSWELVEETNKDFSFDILPDSDQHRWYKVESVLQ